MTKSFLIFLIIAYCIDISAIVKLSVSEPVEKFADGAKSLFKRYKYDPRANLNPVEFKNLFLVTIIFNCYSKQQQSAIYLFIIWYLTIIQAELIAYDGYPVEVHNVTTSDGYILTIYRIPQNNGDQKSQAVILQHGLGGTAADFICPVRGKALGNYYWYKIFHEDQYLWFKTIRWTLLFIKVCYISYQKSSFV